VIDQKGVLGQVSGRLPASPAEAAQQVAVACQIIAKFGHEDLTLGHASVRGPDGRTIYVKRKGKALREVLPQDVIPISLDQATGYLAPGAHLETVMHTEAYLARPDIGAVIHTHPLHSIAVGATEQGLAILSHDGLMFPGGVPIFDGTAGLVTSPDHGKAVAQALGSQRAVLLRNHGILVVGEDIRWAVLAAITLERAAQVQFVAQAVGNLVPIPRNTAGELFPVKYRDEFTDEYWNAWCRLVSEAPPRGLL
jgi:ribulose-5-phosphate 4-epimerase/fuculose-1-phosphate aldolase